MKNNMINKERGFVAIPVDGEYYKLLKTYFEQHDISDLYTDAHGYGSHVSLSHLITINNKIDIDNLTKTLNSVMNSDLGKFNIKNVEYVMGDNIYEFKIECNFFDNLLTAFSDAGIKYTKPYPWLHLTLASGMEQKTPEIAYKIKERIK